MIKLIYLPLIALMIISESKANDISIGLMPIQENGRIKPLDTFARNKLLTFYTKRSLKEDALPLELGKNKLSALEWLMDIALRPEDADKYKVFKVSNPEVVGSLGLEWNTSRLYSRSEILGGLKNQLEYIGKITSIPEVDRTVFDKKMLQLYTNIVHFQDLCYGLSCLINLIPIDHPDIAALLGVDTGERISFYQFMKQIKKINPMIDRVTKMDSKDWNLADSTLSFILLQLHDINQDNFSNLLRIIPPENISDDGQWFSPWDLMDGRIIGENQQAILDNFSLFINAKIDGYGKLEEKFFNQYIESLKPYDSFIRFNNIEREISYNDANYFVKSIVLYILSFIVLAVSWMYKPFQIKLLSYFLLFSGFFFHVYGIILRVLIMQRPPISTLYESIIFVSFIGVLCSIFLEYNRKDGSGIFIGSICGIVLHFVGFGYANDGDTLGMLVAVLNSNFWLATHVTTITTGYGTSLFAGLLGHVYLIQKIRFSGQTKFLKSIYNNMYGATLFALFFTMFGTILGGIWADQSWGRFWGWDPKENGALLIVLWHIMLLHMRMTGTLKDSGFALGLIINNIIVILAWFGVNLLSVGLHSYGFAEGIAKNILIFILVELILGIALYMYATRKTVSKA